MRGAIDEVEHRARAVADPVQRESEQHREEQHLKNVAAGERAEDRRGNDVEQKLSDALLFGRPGV